MGNVFSISLSCDTLITRCWDYSCGEAQLISNLEENLDALTTALAELKERRNDVERRVKMAEEQQQLKRLDQVQGWLQSAETGINEADALIAQSPEQINRLCMGGCCSTNPKSSHKFGKEVVQAIRRVEELKRKGDFDVVADQAPMALATPRPRPCDPTVGLDSTFAEVCSSLEEENIGIIGLYGVGGVGKTRLLTEINNKSHGHGHGFDVVIWVVVSKGFYILKIQDDIAQKIGLSGGATWNDRTTTSEEKATSIFEFLSRRKFLLLLDDIWERVDLSEVGIPIPTQENGCKLIFTTRSLEVCGQMEAHKKIEVKCLSEEESWTLFRGKVGEETLDHSHPHIRELAREVVKECQGLPLALITIGRAMACKNTPKEWEYAIGVLRRSSAASIFPEMGKKVYPLLKFSYDSLPSDKLRSCLLYCSLFSEDYAIHKERLIDCWIGEGFLGEHDNISQARNHGHHIIGSLLHACLLEKANDWEIKMHDVIRDMTLWITCMYEQDKWKFLVEAGYHLTKVPDVGKWTGIRRMSLMKNKIENLREAPHCPELQTLLLNDNQLKVIDSDFFRHMRGLKVLDLSRNKDITELPLGISELTSLEYLNLSCTGIRQLPIEFKALEKLKCLNLQYLRKEMTIPRGLITAFSELQVLRMDGCYTWDRNQWLVEELQCLNNLSTLSVTIISRSGLEGLLSAERLQSCMEEIELRELDDTEQLNILSLGNMKSLNRLTLQNSEKLKVEMRAGEGGMIRAPTTHIQTSVAANQACFQSLDSVWICSLSELREITWLILAPNLRHVIVICCNKLEEIINERKLNQVAELLVGTSTLFARLKYILLQDLPQLSNIYQGALPFPCVESIWVRNCPKLTRLPFNSNGGRAQGNKIRIMADEKWWDELQWDNESSRKAFSHLQY